MLSKYMHTQLLLNSETFTLNAFYLQFLIIQHFFPFMYFILRLMHYFIRILF